MRQVVSVEPVSGEYVKFANGEEYIRHYPDVWHKYYGDTLECHYICKHEEAAYQKFLLDSDT